LLDYTFCNLCAYITLREILNRYRVIKKSLCAWLLPYTVQVHRGFLITLYFLVKVPLSWNLKSSILHYQSLTRCRLWNPRLRWLVYFRLCFFWKWRSFVACIEIQDVLLENIHEFNIWGQTSNTPEVLRSRTLIKLLLFWHIPVVNLRHFLIMFGCVTSVQNYWVLQTKSLHRWVPVITAWRVLRLRVEERPPIWRVAVNKLNKQSRKADKGWSSSLGVGRGANNSSQ